VQNPAAFSLKAQANA